MRSSSRFLMPILFLCPCALYSAVLEDYVAQRDPAYSWRIVASSPQDTTFTRAYTLELTSQQWRSAAEVDATQVTWKHRVHVAVPGLDWLLGSTKDTALILINGGDRDDPLPEMDPQLRLLAAGTRSIVVDLRAVPNQPLRFADESRSRSEDEIIAYSWDRFFTHGDPNWPLQLPMVKSVVACMDAVQESVAQHTDKTVNHFVLTGGSKRGWTAWLTAAVDERVTAIAPIVSDLVNMPRSFAHHWACYGFWAEALYPYEEMGVFAWIDSPRADVLMDIVDPYRYLERLTLPKFLIVAAGDDFFVSDSAQFYVQDLPGETHLRVVPNTNHYLEGAVDSVFNSLAPYYDAFLNERARPVFDWTVAADGALTVATTTPPKTVTLWQSSNPLERDFRLATTGANWVSSVLDDQGEGVYVGQVPMPASGWTACFVELIFDGPRIGTEVFDYTFTTEIVVVPQDRPFETDFNRDRITGPADLTVFCGNWLTENAYRDIWPRRGGDGLVNLMDFALLGAHWGPRQ